MQNVAPSGALARRSRRWLQLAFLTVTGGVFAAILGLMMFVIPFAVPENQIFGFYNFVRTILLLGGSIAALAGIGMAVRAYMTRIDNDVAMLTGAHLAKFLDQRFWFVRNINKRGLGYIDAVLVGPPGALVFRATDATGTYANEKGNWLVHNNKGEWLPAKFNPTAEDAVDIKAVREYLTQHGLREIPVYGVVVFTHEPPLTHVVAREPVVPVAHLSELMDAIQPNYLARDRIDQATVDRIVKLIYDK